MSGPEDEPGANGGLLPRPAPVPSGGQGTDAYVCTTAVEDYDATERSFRIHQPDPQAG